MPVVGCHDKPTKRTYVPAYIEQAVVLTHERVGLLTATLESLRAVSPTLRIVVYDDGSQSAEKQAELDDVEAMGITVRREPKRGLVRTWMQIFKDIAEGVGNSYDPDAGIVLLEDDLLFAQGWDDVLLRMARGVHSLGMCPGAMSCFRCHDEPQTELRDLNGVRAYQSMQHGFQVNMVPAWVFTQTAFIAEAVASSESGGHGIDIWFIGGMAHRLGLTSFISEQSWVAHAGAHQSIAQHSGYRPFPGVGYELVPELTQMVCERRFSAIQ